MESYATFRLPPFRLSCVAPLVQLGLVALVSPLGSLDVFHESLQRFLVVEQAQKLILRQTVVVIAVVVAVALVVVVVVVPTAVISGGSKGSWM